MKTVITTTLVALILIMISGCATIFSKSNYPVLITSEPEGAEVIIKNEKGAKVGSGRTPTTINLDAGSGYFQGQTYTVIFKKDGYSEHKTQISRGVDAWYIVGNFFIPINWIVGYLVVDPITGAMWTLDDVHADLNADTSAVSDGAIKMMTLEDVPFHLSGKLVRVR